MDKAQRDELRRLAGEATDGPWAARSAGPWMPWCVSDERGTEVLVAPAEQGRAARFAAAMHPQVAIALLDTLDAAEARASSEARRADENARTIDAIEARLGPSLVGRSFYMRGGVHRVVELRGDPPFARTECCCNPCDAMISEVLAAPEWTEAHTAAEQEHRERGEWWRTWEELDGWAREWAAEHSVDWKARAEKAELERDEARALLGDDDACSAVVDAANTQNAVLRALLDEVQYYTPVHMQDRIRNAISDIPARQWLDEVCADARRAALEEAANFIWSECERVGSSGQAMEDCAKHFSALAAKETT